MNISNQYLSRWGSFMIFTIIVATFTLASTIVIDRFRKQEIQRVETIATAMKFMHDENTNDPIALELILTILKDNNSIPVILTDKDKQPILEEGTYRNIPEHIIKNPERLKNLIEKMEKTYEPFRIRMPNGEDQFIFYSNSELLDKLRFYPWILVLFIGGYFLISFYLFRTIKKTDENFLWAGLAKETAHQIGTPLSSMLGWIEILKLEHNENEGVKEIEKDINRLVVISERFSKIGSVPELTDLNLKETLQQNYDYLKSRISSQISFNLHFPQEDILVPHNRILISWVMENLVKNAVDAMKGSGNLDIKLTSKKQEIWIDFRDTGCGIAKNQVKKVFHPGFSTKQRGWGLGLSLVKRVIEEFHNGSIKVVASEVGKGTTFRVILPFS